MMTEDEIKEVFQKLGISGQNEREKVLTQGKTYCKVEEEKTIDIMTDSVSG